MAILTPTPRHLERAVAALRAGNCIGMPTETVYGLAADARRPAAVANIFALKGRPADHPLIVHLAEPLQVRDWATRIPRAAWALAEAFWPGPLTLILPRRDGVLDAVTGGQDTVGLRVPAHPVAQAVLRAFGDGLAAPSANRFGRISPTTAAHVVAEFGRRLPIVLDGGEAPVGIESTIVAVGRRGARVLRPGIIGAAAIARVAGALDADRRSPTPRVSGSLKGHYAPRTPVELVPGGELAARAATLRDRGMPFAVLARSELHGAHGLAIGRSARDYAHRLYAALRELDAGDHGRILVEAPPRGPAWAAINDRLARAAAGSGDDDAS